MSVPYQHLTSPKNVDSGVSDMLLIAPVDTFATDGIKCPAPPESGATLADLVTITEDHEFSTGNGFIKLLCAPFKNQITTETIGDVGFRKMKITLEAHLAGSYPDLHGFIAQLQNTPIIAMIKDSNCEENMYYQLGCDCIYAYASSVFTTGTNQDGTKEYVVTIEVPAKSIHIYKGSVTYLGDSV